MIPVVTDYKQCRKRDYINTVKILLSRNSFTNSSSVLETPVHCVAAFPAEPKKSSQQHSLARVSLLRIGSSAYKDTSYNAHAAKAVLC